MLCPKCGGLNAEWQIHCSYCQTDLHSAQMAQVSASQRKGVAKRLVFEVAILGIIGFAIYHYLPNIQDAFIKRWHTQKSVTDTIIYERYDSIDYNFGIEYPRKWHAIDNITDSQGQASGSVEFRKYSQEELAAGASLKQAAIKLTITRADNPNLEKWLWQHDLDVAYLGKQGIIAKQSTVQGRLVSGIAITYQSGKPPIFRRAYFMHKNLIFEIANATDDYRPYKKELNRVISSIHFSD